MPERYVHVASRLAEGLRRAGRYRPAATVTLNPGDSINTAISSASAGDVIFLRNGSYGAITPSRAFVTPITILGESRSGVVVAGAAFNGVGVSGYRLENLTLQRAAGSSPLAGSQSYDNCALNVWQRASNITVRNCNLWDANITVAVYATTGSMCDSVSIIGCDIRGALDDGMALKGASNMLIQGCTFGETQQSSTHNDVIQFQGTCNWVTIEQNRFVTTRAYSADALNDQVMMIREAQGAITNVIIRNNLIKWPRSKGINMQDITGPVWVCNNTIQETASGFGDIYSGNPPDPAYNPSNNGNANGVRVWNNIVKNGLYQEGGSTFEYNSNNHWTSPASGASWPAGSNRTTGSAGFVDTTDYDLAAGSVCKDSGIVSSYTSINPSVDFNGDSRAGNPSRGAQE